jgi:hypothetical protein
MARTVESTPDAGEMREAIQDLFYAANQCLTYHFWYMDVEPLIYKHTVGTNPNYVGAFMRNSIIEANLMFLRKTHEFFKKKGQEDKPDNLYAYLWKFRKVGDVFTPAIITELHKRVGHVTVREARNGKLTWLMYELTTDALPRWIEFFEYLATYYKGDEDAATLSAGAHRSLGMALTKVRRDVARERSKRAAKTSGRGDGGM